jgi:sarcosine oxidase
MNRRSFISQAATVTAGTTLLPLSDLYAAVSKEVSSSATQQNKYEVIVVGVGSMGSSTCYQLAKQGVKVLGLEQFDIPHDLGSHSGQSRIIRKAYFEHPDYVPLLERAYSNWNALEEETGTSLYYKTGLVYFGKSTHPLISGLRESAQKYSIDVRDLSANQTQINYPNFKIPSNFERLVEPDAGFVTPERAILVYTQQAIQLGAEIHTKEAVIEWKEEDQAIRVKTTKGEYTCEKLILTSGPWAGKVMPTLSKSLKVTKQVVAWVNPKNWKAFELGKFPCWTIADDQIPGIFYGFPVLSPSEFGGPVGLKIAHHFQGEITDPDQPNRGIIEEEELRLRYALTKYIPEGYHSTHVLKTCLYTNTPDENFILDFLPGHNQKVVLAAGFSGHGFKFASVVGEIMADLALKGNSALPIEFLSATRFLGK